MPKAHSTSRLLLPNYQVLREPILIIGPSAQHIMRLPNQRNPLLLHLNVNGSPHLIESLHDFTNNEFHEYHICNEHTQHPNHKERIDLSKSHLVDALAANREGAEGEAQ